jgi:hypothetical protein
MTAGSWGRESDHHTAYVRRVRGQVQEKRRCLLREKTGVGLGLAVGLGGVALISLYGSKAATIFDVQERVTCTKQAIFSTMHGKRLGRRYLWLQEDLSSLQGRAFWSLRDPRPSFFFQLPPERGALRYVADSAYGGTHENNKTQWYRKSASLENPSRDRTLR